jgi:regulatory protein
MHHARSQPRAQPKPLDAAALDRLALRYVERFATTRGKLAVYLAGKIRQRGWDGAPADPVALAEKLAGLGYIDDRAFAEARAGAMTRRGLGKRRVAGALRQAGVQEEDAEAVMPGVDEHAVQAAMAYARKRRMGPYAATPADRVLLEKQIGALVRAGHDFGLARRIAALAPGESLEE